MCASATSPEIKRFEKPSHNDQELSIFAQRSRPENRPFSQLTVRRGRP